MNLRIITIAAGTLLLGGCAKGELRDITAPVSGARIKFFNFAVATPPAATPTVSLVPGVNFYANDAKITAITSGTGTESTLGTTSGGVGNGGLYSVIAPNQYKVTGRVAATTDKGVAIASLPVTLADGKFYSFYMSGYYNTTTKLSEAFAVEDVFPSLPDVSVAYVRFVNASANAGAVTLYTRIGTFEFPIGAAVPYKAGGDFITVPEGLYDLSARIAGSATSVVTRTGVSFLAGRVYTVSAFGDATVTGTTAGNRIRLDNTANR